MKESFFSLPSLSSSSVSSSESTSSLNVSLFVTCVSKEKPRLPLREECNSLGVEAILLPSFSGKEEEEEEENEQDKQKRKMEKNRNEEPEPLNISEIFEETLDEEKSRSRPSSQPPTRGRSRNIQALARMAGTRKSKRSTKSKSKPASLKEKGTCSTKESSIHTHEEEKEEVKPQRKLSLGRRISRSLSPRRLRSFALRGKKKKKTKDASEPKSAPEVDSKKTQQLVRSVSEPVLSIHCPSAVNVKASLFRDCMKIMEEDEEDDSVRSSTTVVEKPDAFAPSLLSLQLESGEDSQEAKSASLADGEVVMSRQIKQEEELIGCNADVLKVSEDEEGEDQDQDDDFFVQNLKFQILHQKWRQYRQISEDEEEDDEEDETIKEEKMREEDDQEEAEEETEETEETEEMYQGGEEKEEYEEEEEEENYKVEENDPDSDESSAETSLPHGPLMIKHEQPTPPRLKRLVFEQERSRQWSLERELKQEKEMEITQNATTLEVIQTETSETSKELLLFPKDLDSFNEAEDLIGTRLREMENMGHSDKREVPLKKSCRHMFSASVALLVMLTLAGIATSGTMGTWMKMIQGSESYGKPLEKRHAVYRRQTRRSRDRPTLHRGKNPS